MIPVEIIMLGPTPRRDLMRRHPNRVHAGPACAIVIGDAHAIIRMVEFFKRRSDREPDPPPGRHKADRSTAVKAPKPLGEVSCVIGKIR